MVRSIFLCFFRCQRRNLCDNDLSSNIPLFGARRLKLFFNVSVYHELVDELSRSNSIRLVVCANSKLLNILHE